MSVSFFDGADGDVSANEIDPISARACLNLDRLLAGPGNADSYRVTFFHRDDFSMRQADLEARSGCEGRPPFLVDEDIRCFAAEKLFEMKFYRKLL